MERSEFISRLLAALDTLPPQDRSPVSYTHLVGSAINQGTIATIQDTQHLKVAVTIDEDDIKKVAVGQKAVIKSDATGDEEIAGTVTQVSVTAGQSGGFSAEITVDNTDSGLLVGCLLYTSRCV